MMRYVFAGLVLLLFVVLALPALGMGWRYIRASWGSRPEPEPEPQSEADKLPPDNTPNV